MSGFGGNSLKDFAFLNVSPIADNDCRLKIRTAALRGAAVPLTFIRCVKNFNLLRWLPFVGSVALMVLIVVVSVVTIKELRQATYWRKHTFQVILNAQAYEDGLIDTQSRIQRYAAAGAPNLLIEYQSDTNAELQEFNKLTELTRDNPGQQQRLKDLNAAVKAVFDYDNRVVGVYARQGKEAAQKMEESTEETDDVSTAVQDLEKFKGEEEKLLDTRDAKEQTDYHKAAQLLILGSIIAATLLMFSNLVASREMKRRREAETKQRELIQELQKTLAEVKTLSGLIPICGWCKKVRSDNGFWQSVEQYVRAKTDATFTHGMCPACSEKWKSDSLRAAGK